MDLTTVLAIIGSATGIVSLFIHARNAILTQRDQRPKLDIDCHQCLFNHEGIFYLVLSISNNSVRDIHLKQLSLILNGDKYSSEHYISKTSTSHLPLGGGQELPTLYGKKFPLYIPAQDLQTLRFAYTGVPKQDEKMSTQTKLQVCTNFHRSYKVSLQCGKAGCFHQGK
jgi:hypothetical protein